VKIKERKLPYDEALWQLYHENSKGSRFDRQMRPEAVLAWQKGLLPSLVYEGHPALRLPPPRAAFAKPLHQALLDRETARATVRRLLSFEELATLLHYSYGITRPNDPAVYPTPFRTVPSAGALYPLELYIHVAAVDGVECGLYHYEPANGVIRRIADGDRSSEIAARVVQPEAIENASAVIFITAAFERSTTKYGERGYRFVLLEAGHVAQNLALLTCAMDLAGTHIGGFFDRPIDEFLAIDGIAQSTLYLYTVGGAALAPGAPGRGARL
jgi:SagB-type dehydrogenase family enzyme